MGLEKRKLVIFFKKAEKKTKPSLKVSGVYSLQAENNSERCCRQYEPR